MKAKKYYFYPSFLSKQGLLFKAAKEIMFKGSKYSFPKKAFKKVNLFKQNNFVKIPKSMGGGKQIHGSRFCSWGILNHLIQNDQAGIYIYYSSAANSIITKRNKFKQLKLI